jgi:hypothetical protein
MPWLSWAQRRTGKALGSNAVVADGTQTLLCTYLSAVLLAGLVLNAILGWSWADPLAGLVIAAVAVKEGRAAWRGEGCCGPTTHLTALDPAAAGGCCPDGACDDGCCSDAGADHRPEPLEAPLPLTAVPARADHRPELVRSPLPLTAVPARVDHDAADGQHEPGSGR